MDKETAKKIREWEKERDRNLRIHCPHVAAKFQRFIDKELKKENNNSNETKEATIQTARLSRRSQKSQR